MPDADQAGIPGHVGVTPLHPGEAAVAAQLGTRVEVGAGGDDRAAIVVGAVQSQDDKGVHGFDRSHVIHGSGRPVVIHGLARPSGRLRFPRLSTLHRLSRPSTLHGCAGDRVIFADRQHDAQLGMHPQVREPPAHPLRRERTRLVSVHTKQLSRRIGTHHDDAVAGVPRPAAVLVHPRPDVHPGHHLHDDAVPLAQQRRPATLGRPGLRPVEVVPVVPWPTQPDAGHREVFRGDRGRPGTIWQGGEHNSTVEAAPTSASMTSEASVECQCVHS